MMQHDQIVNESILLPVGKKSKIITPYERLKKRILKGFEKKVFIGDIIINEVEYEILLDYFRTKCNAIMKSHLNAFVDPVFATALVQIGIKYYNGNFWGHVAKLLNVERISTIHQGIIGESFIKTLLSYNKCLLNRSEKVNNILMHGFVSDYYANEMFDFLFKYYNIDLERDIERNNADMMNRLIEVIQRDDNTGRTYLLVKQTANAISTNIRGGKIRIRRLLRLIDKCFWEQITPANPVSRISILFNNWQENSKEFRAQYNRFHNSSFTGGGKKSFSSPYIKCDFKCTSFKLILPTQLIKFEFDQNIKWYIYMNEEVRTISASLYQAVTGYKTDALEISIKDEDIFNDFTIELVHCDDRIRIFKIKADCIRFFDKDGDYLNSDSSLPKGEVYAFTRENEIPRSEALIESEPIGSLIRTYFEFEYGDIVRLPDGKPISIGKKLEEGLLRRKAIDAAHVIYNDVNIPIYSAPPTVLLKIAAKRANGTAINVNGNIYRLFDSETTVIELGDRSGETGYIINLKDYGCDENNIYTVFVDVPNDRTNRFWQFSLVNGICYEFEEAPYIFKSKGTIRFNEGLDVYSRDPKIMKNSDENSFNFAIQPDIDYLQFELNIKGNVIRLCFDIPVLKWKFGTGIWNIEKPSDIWHSNFPSIIYFKYPDEKITISLDEPIDDKSSFEGQSVTYMKLKSLGFFVCDTTRFKSWFGREKVKRSIYIDLPKNRTELIRVITRSVIASQILKTDFESNKLIGEFDIIGNANYYVDVMLLETKEVLAEKLPVIDGKFVFEGDTGSGKYKISVFEDEADDTGFGISNFLPIGEFIHNIINPYDLQGKNIAIKYIKKGENSIFQMQLSCKYIICNLRLIDRSDKHNYKGVLVINTTYGSSPIYYAVNVNIPDLNKLQYISLTYYDGYDNIEFLYDTYRKIIVKNEEKGLTRAVRYRRYESLYPEDYIYVGEFVDGTPDVARVPAVAAAKAEDDSIVLKERNNNELLIEQMGLSIRTYNCLHRAKVRTAEEIMKIGTKELFKVRNLGRHNIEELVSKMRTFGFVMDDIEYKPKK